jgi:alanine racemase
MPPKPTPKVCCANVARRGVTPVIRARIDSAALQYNLQVLRARAPHSRVMAVVKANAYGHGLVTVARALGGGSLGGAAQQAGADAFAVARLEEAQELRNAGIQQRVVLLEGVASSDNLQVAAQLGLDLVVHEAAQLPLLAAWRGPQRFDLWVKVDSGMNRLGFRPEQFAAVWSQLRALPLAVAQLRVMTHLASADLPGDASIGQQLARFQSVPPAGVEVSIANSAALLGLPATHRDWVRPGLALYGVSPFADQHGQALGLRPAMTFETTVIAVRDVPNGESVGYGQRWQATRTSRVAILAAGYADGLLRSLPSGAPVLLQGQRMPLVGRVSMDMIAVDVTALPACQVGDRAELWGTQLPVEEVAAAAGTIPYELLCALRARVPRTT